VLSGILKWAGRDCRYRRALEVMRAFGRVLNFKFELLGGSWVPSFSTDAFPCFQAFNYSISNEALIWCGRSYVRAKKKQKCRGHVAHKQTHLGGIISFCDLPLQVANDDTGGILAHVHAPRRLLPARTHLSISSHSPTEMALLRNHRSNRSPLTSLTTRAHFCHPNSSCDDRRRPNHY
jgi:hypothetical protein